MRVFIFVASSVFWVIAGSSCESHSCTNDADETSLLQLHQHMESGRSRQSNDPSDFSFGNLPGIDLVMNVGEFAKLEKWLSPAIKRVKAVFQQPTPWNIPKVGPYARNRIGRTFLGGDSSAGEEMCTEDKYEPSPLELAWRDNAHWTGKNVSMFNWMKDACTFNTSHPKYKQCIDLLEHCKHMPEEQADAWIQQNVEGNFSSKIFSKQCIKGQVAHFIEPLAGLMRDPRFFCPKRAVQDLYGVDWLVFPTGGVLPNKSRKARFYDAGGSHFNDAMTFFLETYKGHGIPFDEVYVWEFQKQGKEAYWKDTPPEIRAFWEPRVTFYDGVGVSADKYSPNNPVSRMFLDCHPEDYCVLKLDIDNGAIENPLAQQLLEMPDDTRAKVDEFFFEHHVTGVMQAYWTNTVDFHETFADSHKLFSDLRHLGVRAHSWV